MKSSRFMPFCAALDHSCRNETILTGYEWSYTKRDREGILTICYEQRKGPLTVLMTFDPMTAKFTAIEQ